MLSVIIPTYNGKHKIVNALKSLENQTLKDFEVIVVIDGSTDGTLEILNESRFDLPQLKVIFQENAGRSKVRNTGVTYAQGNILLFMDDDMTFEANSLEKHVLHHTNYPESAVTGGTFEDESRSISDFDRFKSEERNSWLIPFNQYPYKQTHQVIYLSAANLSISKELFERVNGFNEALTDNEDQDLGVRLRAIGATLYIDTSIPGCHNENLTVEQYIKRQLDYSTAKKHTFPRTFKNRLGKWFYGSRIWIRLVRSDKLLLWLPKKMRYRLYANIVQGNLLKRLME